MNDMSTLAYTLAYAIWAFSVIGIIGLGLQKLLKKKDKPMAEYIGVKQV